MLAAKPHFGYEARATDMQAQPIDSETDTLTLQPEDTGLAEPTDADSTAPIRPAEAPSAPRDPALALAIVELELALDAAEADRAGFSEAVREATRSVGGEFLFSLPAAGLTGDIQKIAAVRLPAATGAPDALAFVMLSEDGTRMTVRPPDEETMRLARFADSFVDVLERF